MDASDGEHYEKYAEELIRFATFLVGPIDAQDVVANAVLRAFAAPAWATVREPRAYLYRVVVNEARMNLRADRRRRAYEQRSAGAEAVEDVVMPDPRVLDAVAHLSERQRAVIYLTYWDDLAPDAIATLLGISDGRVRRHLARARGILRRTLDDH